MKDIVKNNKMRFTNDHYGKWVALSPDRKVILDYSSSLSALTRKFGTKEVVYTKPQDPALNYAF
jgi:hypothetical protein